MNTKPPDRRRGIAGSAAASAGDLSMLQEQVGETVDIARGKLDVLRGNLAQVRKLTGDATESISREFQAINELIGDYEALLPEAARRDAIAAELDGRVSALVVLLQFGDIVDQLLKFTDRQVVEVEDYLDSLATGHTRQPAKEAGPRPPEDDSPRGLRLSDARKPTAQTSMQSGDIELF